MNIARTIDVPVRDGWRRMPLKLEKINYPAVRYGSSVIAKEVTLAQLLNEILPGQQVEHLARPTYANPSKYFGGAMATSLFFQAVHRCFESHHALVFRPEVLAFLINHEIAVTVKQNVEDYRHLFTTEPDKQVIAVQDNSLVLGGPSNWDRALALFDGALRNKVPAGIMEKMLVDYSTNTPEAVISQLIAFMDAASPFYSYEMHTMCGIPRVILLGEPNDYTRLYASACGLSELFGKHMGLYFKRLLPVLQQIAVQAEPNVPVDEEFWSSIYKHHSGSGTSSFGGWLATFVHYVKDSKTGALNAKKEPPVTPGRRAVDANIEEYGPSIESNSTGNHIATVPFKWLYHGSEMNMTLAGGVLGIEATDDSLCPVLSYAILHAAK